MAIRREIKLLSPVGAEPAVFPWPLTSFDGREGFEELRVTFNFVCEDIPELRMPCQNILSEVDTSSYDSVKESCERFNRAVVSLQRMWKGTSCSKKYLERHRPSSPLLKHILLQCYYRAVPEPEKLNQYPPFSPEVYGETSFELVEKMISKIKWPENGLFIDLGSGVGQVVLQVAASVPQLKMAYGVERADLPSSYAKAMDSHFKFWMNWYGKSYSDYQMVKDDFLTPRWSDVISEADMVFANNFAFGPQVNHELKQRIQHMKEGSKIVSSLSLCPMKFEISERNLSDVAAILRVEELSVPPNTQAVSWTGRDFSFFLHTVDRTMLERYFERKVRRERAGNAGSGSSHSSASSVNNEDSMASGKSGGSSDGGKTGSGDAESVAVQSTPFPNGHQAAEQKQQNGEVGGSDEDEKKHHHHHHHEKKKSKRSDVNGSSQQQQQQPHRGRGRPAKIPRLSGSSSSLASPVTLKKSTSIKSTLKGAEEIILGETTTAKSEKKRKREKTAADKAEEEETPSHPPKSLKTSIKMPQQALDLLYRRVVTSTTQPDLSTREGRLDAFWSKFKAKMVAFLEQQTSQQKQQLEGKLEAARKKNAELREKEKVLCQELSQLASQNHARLRQQVDSLASLGGKGVPTVQTLAEFVAESKRIVKRNVNLRDLIPTTSQQPTTAAAVTTTVSQPSLTMQSLPPPSYPLAPFQTAAPLPPQQQRGLTEAQQQQAMSLFNSTLAALLPFYGAQPNPAAISNHQNMLMSQFMATTGPPGPPPPGPWFPQPPPIQQQQQPAPPPPTTTSSGPTPTPVPASVEEALKAIMATASITTTDKSGAGKKGRRSGTPQIEQSTTPDVKKTPQRRTPSKPRKQAGGGGDGTDPSPPTQVVTASSDMAEFLSHMRLPEAHPRPPSTTTAIVVATTASGSSSSSAGTSTTSTTTTTAATSTSTVTTTSSSTKPPPSGPVFHISSMVFRPSATTPTGQKELAASPAVATTTSSETTVVATEPLPPPTTATPPVPEVPPSQA